MLSRQVRKLLRRFNVKRRLVIWLTGRGAVRLAIAAALVAFTVTVFLSRMPSSSTWSYWSHPLAGKAIVLDAGHGGVDGGAVSREGIIEKDLNLSIVLYLRDYLQQAGAVVSLTREGDYDLAEPETKGYSRRKTEDLLERAGKVQASNPQLTVSVHMNSIPSPRWSGAQTFYHSRNAEGKRLAADIQEEIRVSLENTNRVPKTRDEVYLLKSLESPVVLVEVGFLSHPEEARLLADDAYQKKVAAAIYRGILRYVSGQGSRP